MRAQKVLAVPKWTPKKPTKKSQPSLPAPVPPIVYDCSLMAIKFVTPARVLLFSSFLFLSYFLFNVTRSRMGVNFPPFRDLRLGFQYLRSRSVAFLTGHFMWHTQIHSAGEWRCRSDWVGIRYYPPKPHRSRGTEIDFWTPCDMLYQ